MPMGNLRTILWCSSPTRNAIKRKINNMRLKHHDFLKPLFTSWAGFRLDANTSHKVIGLYWLITYT